MATNSLRGTLLRTLPALLLVLLTLFAARQPSPASPGAAVSSAARGAHPVSSALPADADPAEPSTADGTSAPVDVAAAVLVSQFTAGVRGSRAPPVASA